MTAFVLHTQVEPNVPRVTVRLLKPGSVQDLNAFKSQAQAAARATGPAPAVHWTADDLGREPMVLGLLDKEFKVQPSSARLCVRAAADSGDGEDLHWEIASGAVHIPANGELKDVITGLWAPIKDRLGTIQEFVLDSNGLHMETLLEGDHSKRRFRLVAGSSLAPGPNSEKRFVWEQVPWGDSSLDDTHKNPSDRLEDLRKESDKRLHPNGNPAAIELVARFGRESERTARVVVAVRQRTAPQGQETTEAREWVSPSWALSLGGADWTPGLLAVLGDNLDAAPLCYSDGDDPFDEPSHDADHETSLEWTDRPTPKLLRLASSPPLLSTGELAGAGANSPYLWQMATLAVGKEGTTEKSEHGIWIRYHIEPLAERDPSRPSQSDSNSSLSRPFRIDGLSNNEDWMLDLGLLPDFNRAGGKARVWLELKEKKAVLTMSGAHVRAATPGLCALREPLADPEAVPNQANRFQGLHRRTRIILANDRAEPAAVAGAAYALQADFDQAAGALRLKAWEEAHDVVVAYVPGPMGGIDLISRSRDNLTSRRSANPTDPPPPDRVRRYESGRVAVHLRKNIELAPGANASGGLLGQVRVGELADLFVPRSEAIAALLPWALSHVEPDQQHLLEPFHRNLLLEGLEWAISAPDRHAPRPAEAPPTVDPAGQEEIRRDYRDEEELLSLAQALRDRFSNATKSPLSANHPTAPIAGWLPGVKFRLPNNTELSPQLRWVAPNSNQLDDLPAMQFQWSGDGSMSLQNLKLNAGGITDSQEDSPQWFNAWLRWAGERPDEPILQVHADGSSGARLAAHSDTPLLEHRAQITAVTAGWMAGRLWVIFATDASKGLFAWEPLTNREPHKLVLELDSNRIDSLSLDAGEDPGVPSLVLVVIQGTQCQVFRFSGEPVEEGVNGYPIGRVVRQSTNLSEPIRFARIAAQRLFLTAEKTAFVIKTDSREPSGAVSWNMGEGEIVAMDVRAGNTPRLLIAAFAMSDGKVRLFYWNTDNVSGPPNSTSCVLTIGDRHDNEKITALAIQPVKGQSEDSKGAFVYAATQEVGENGHSAGRMVAWKLALISSDEELPSISQKDFSEMLDGQVLSIVRQPVSFLLTEPSLRDTPVLNGNDHAANWLAAITNSDAAGHASLITWPVYSWSGHAQDIVDSRPLIGPPLKFEGHEGAIAAAAIVPGRRRYLDGGTNYARESRFGPWLVTGGVDGTVRVWDPETGVERSCHTVSPSNAWLDTLGVVRTKLEPPDSVQFWVEPLSVPSLEDNQSRRRILSLSTLGDPVVLRDPVRNSRTTAFRFLAQNLPLEKHDVGGEASWRPVPFDDRDSTHAFRHGVFGCDGMPDKAPQSVMPCLDGVPVEITGLSEIAFFGNPGEVSEEVKPKRIVFDGVLSNPSDSPPDGGSVPQAPPGTIQITFSRETSTDSFTMSAKGGFDWRFPLSDQIPSGSVSVLPGRLARLAGEVTWSEGQGLRLQPNDSQAEVLGHLRGLVEAPELALDPVPESVRFREHPKDPGTLKPLGSPLPFPSGSSNAPIVATDVGFGPSGDPTVLIASQTNGPDESGAALLADLESGRGQARLADGFKRARLVVERLLDDARERLTVVGVAHDGTVRIRRLWDLTRSTEPAEPITPTAIAAADQEWARYALPSPAEDVQVFDAPGKGSRWLAARCRDGSAWLWEATDGARRYELSLADTAITAVAFGPAIPDGVFNDENSDYRPWREFFGKFSSAFITAKSLEAVLAVGGADGSVHVYAVDPAEGPILVRSLFELHNPIASLGLVIDEVSLEAGQLTQTISQASRGLVLFACDGSSPPKLVELLSGTSLISPDIENHPSSNGQPNPFAKQAVASCGILLHASESVRIVLYGRMDNESQVVVVTKEVAENKNVIKSVRVSVDEGLGEVFDLVATHGPKAYAIVLQARRWSVYSVESGQIPPLYSRDESAIDVAASAVFCSGESGTPSFRQRYLVALRPNGSLDTWKQTDPPANASQWDKVADNAIEGAWRIDATALGRVVVPMVACRGAAGQRGHLWQVDLGAPGWTWPETLGPVDNSTPVALTCLEGMPFLAVARPSDVTIWNLTTGQRFGRITLDRPAEALDMAADLGRLWLLVATRGEKDDEISYRLIDASSGSSSAIQLNKKGPRGGLDVRLIAQADGVHVVTVERKVAGTAVTLAVSTERIVPEGMKLATAITTSAIPGAEGSLALVDLARFGDGPAWVLIRCGADLSVVSVPSGTPLAYKLADTEGTYKPSVAAFDLDPDPTAPTRPRVWTVDDRWSTIGLWGLSASGENATLQNSFDAPSVSPNGAPSHLAVIRSDGRSRLVAVARNNLAMWDLDAPAHDKVVVVRTDRLEGAEPRVTAMALAAAALADTKAGCIRLWDQETGRLRQRLFTSTTQLGSMDRPRQLTAVSSSARPRLVVAGESSGLSVIDLQSCRVLGVPGNVPLSSLSTSLSKGPSADDPEQLMIAGIDTSDGGHRVKIWRSPLGKESQPHDWEDLDFDDPRSVALLRLADRTLLAMAGAHSLAIRDVGAPPSQAGTNALAADLANDQGRFVFEPNLAIETVRLARAVHDDCVSAAVGLKADGEGGYSVVLLDLPLKPAGEDGYPSRPMTAWKTAFDSRPGPLALWCDQEGPRLVVGCERFRAGALLRISSDGPPLCDLDVRLLRDKAFLTARITPSRRLDLGISIEKPPTLGLPNKLELLTARAALVQGAYTCFLVDSIEENDFRLAGGVVLWDAPTSNNFQGLLWLEDVRPTPQDWLKDNQSARSSNGEFAKARVEMPAKEGNSRFTFDAFGPRVRLRAIPFDSDSQSIETLAWREVLSWYLAGSLGGPASTQNAEWHLSDAVLDVPGESQSPPQLVRGLLWSEGSAWLEGDFPATLRRTIEGETEVYQLSLDRTVYAVRQFAKPDRSTTDTSRDDMVYPAPSDGAVGLAFDLVEPRSSSTDSLERFRLATLLVDNNVATLFPVSSDQLPVDLSEGSGVVESLPRQPILVPQLVHRQAHGARVRGCATPALEFASLSSLDGAVTDNPAGLAADATKVCLLAPLARTPRGMAALTLDVLTYPRGRRLDWTRLQTECVLTIYREGGALFASGSSPNGRNQSPQPSLVNLLTGTVLRAGAPARTSPALFDDAWVQAHALRAGVTGVLLVRTADTRGRVAYRFVNSPYHSLVPLSVRRQENKEELPSDHGPPYSVDPRLLPPHCVSKLRTLRAPRYQPVSSSRDRAESRCFHRLLSNAIQDGLGAQAVHLAEVPALRSWQRPAAPEGVVDNRDGAFVPHTLELSFGLTKPGAVFHQVVQCLDKNAGHAALPTTLARREPQRFAPSPRAKIEIHGESLVRDASTLKATVRWTETLGEFPLYADQFEGQFTIGGNATDGFTITPTSGKHILRWIARLGEGIELLTTANKATLPVPLTPFSNKRPVDAFDLFVITCVGLDESRSLPGMSESARPLLVAINASGQPIKGSACALESLLETVPHIGESYKVWRLRRENGEAKLLKWLNTLGNPYGLRLIWWHTTEIDKEENAGDYALAPKLDPILQLRDVPYEPQSPRLAAVLRQPEIGLPGLFAGAREVTLFDGPAASCKGVEPKVQKPEGMPATLSFQATDAETITMADGMPDSSKCGLFVVKVFETGATLVTSRIATVDNSTSPT